MPENLEKSTCQKQKIAGKYGNPLPAERIDMHLKLFTGSCHEAAARLATELDLINDADLEIVDNALPADERGMTPVVCLSLEIDGDETIEGYDNVRSWMDRFHRERVLDKAKRQFHQILVPMGA